MAAAALQPKWGNGQLTGSSAVHYSQKGGDTSECKKNSAGRFASKMMKSEASRVDVKARTDAYPSARAVPGMSSGTG